MTTRNTLVEARDPVADAQDGVRLAEAFADAACRRTAMKYDAWREAADEESAAFKALRAAWAELDRARSEAATESVH